MERYALVITPFSQLDEVPHGFGRVLGVQLQVQGALGCEEAGVAFEFDAAGFEHVFFVGEDRAGGGGRGG